MACDPLHVRGPSIRRAQVEDAGALAILQNSANAGQMAVVWGEGGRDWRATGEREIARGGTEMSVANTLVATFGDDVVGFVNFALNDDPPPSADSLGAPFAALRSAFGPCLYLRAMAVDEAHGGQGVAKRLLDVSESAAETFGARALGVIVHESNDRLIAHYERRGFREIARDTVREHVTYPVGSALVALRKSLGAIG